MIKELLDELGFHFNETYMFKDEAYVLMPFEDWFTLVPLAKGELIKPRDAKDALRILLKLTPVRRKTYGDCTCKDLDCDDCPFNVVECIPVFNIGDHDGDTLNNIWEEFKKINSIDKLVEDHLKKEL